MKLTTLARLSELTHRTDSAACRSFFEAAGLPDERLEAWGADCLARLRRATTAAIEAVGQDDDALASELVAFGRRIARAQALARKRLVDREALDERAASDEFMAIAKNRKRRA